MNKLTKEGHQIIMQDGHPAFVVVPYDDYRGIVDVSPGQTLPHEIVNLHVVQGFNLIRAWRVYLKKTQREIAEKMGISQAGYSQIEKSENLRDETKHKAAIALGIDRELLDID